MEGSQIGIFKDFWDGKHPHHLPLMNLRSQMTNKDWNVEISLQRIEKIFQEYDRGKVIQDLELLIKHDNWRPQLIFCIAILRIKEEELLHLKNALWNKLNEYGSWIIPQLAVTASIVDLNFEERAKEVIRAQKRIIDLESLNGVEILYELSRGNTPFEDKSLIAIRWKENLLNLIKERKIKTDYYKV